MYGYIYETTNMINGNTYIGKKEGEFDKTYYGSGMVLKQALKKYGRENFEVNVLSTYNSLDDLNNAEVMFIETRNPAYNIAKGGTGGNTLARADEAYKQEIVKKRALTLKNIHASLTEEERKTWNENISKAKKGIATTFGYHHTEEAKARSAESNRKTWKKKRADLSDPWHENHAEAMKARRGISNYHSYKPIEVNGIVYESFVEASKKLDVTRQTLLNWIRKGKASYANKT
jgi:group I intron endonuclease